MMVSAEQLLREIPSESLQQLLVSVQHDNRPSRLTGIAPLDSYLWSPTDGPTSSGSPSLNPGDTFHLQGPSGSGKTHLLYFLIATCILPPRYLAHTVGGWNRAATVFDMDGTFCISRFYALLVDRLRKSLPLASTSPVVEKCLKLLHVFRPESSNQLAVTLAHLSRYHSKHFPDTELGMVAIHSVDAFHWLDRFKAEQLHGSWSTRNAAYQTVFAQLDDIRLRHGVITVITHWGLPQSANAPSVGQDMPRIGGPNQALSLLSTQAPAYWQVGGLDSSLAYFLSLNVVPVDPSKPSNRDDTEISIDAQISGRPGANNFRFKIAREGLSFWQVDSYSSRSLLNAR